MKKILITVLAIIIVFSAGALTIFLYNNVEQDKLSQIKISESEVVAQNVPSANIDYFLKTYWEDKRDGTRTGSLRLNLCLSVWGITSGDYDTISYLGTTPAKLKPMQDYPVWINHAQYKGGY